eukprot:NODE_1532_length_823_cov_123.275862_g1484_i0.p1 GENE.NODE_1532_length_823_cov_123.275862_g1484_i0~~NODE_1532_length_823_cov_123.275862_g1484_i0.p1  ORF type:complete len:218 (+),score=59.81 NODE_1532_length_823_cov_123.275862_g1484_i0:91-744(+)
MMKQVLILGLLAIALADQVCLPTKFQWQRTQQFTGFDKKSGFDLMKEYFDHDSAMFRNRFVFYMDNEQYFYDYLYHLREKKMWTVTGKTHGGEIKCTVGRVDMPDPMACSMKNATITGSFFIAGDVYTNVWVETGDDQKGHRYYQEFSLTNSDNVPISSREVVEKEGESFELYYDYSINLPGDAFQPDPICPTEFNAESKRYTLEDVQKMTHNMFKF